VVLDHPSVFKTRKNISKYIYFTIEIIIFINKKQLYFIPKLGILPSNYKKLGNSPTNSLYEDFKCI